MFGIRRKAPGIGLHIGSKFAALSIVKHRGKAAQVFDLGSIPISGLGSAPGDPEKLGRELASLVKVMNCAGKGVVSAVSGPQAYIRNIILPRMRLKELRDAAFYEAAVLLPIPVEEAAIDVFPVREFSDSEGKKVELFFVAARRQAISKIDTVCRMAGLKLMAVELETLAISRIILEPNHVDDQVLLYIGNQYSIFTVLKYGAVIFQHYFSPGNDCLKNNRNSTAGDKNNHLAGLISETAKALEFFVAQHGRPVLDNIIICGAGAGLEGVDLRLSSALDRKFVAQLEPPGLTIACRQNERPADDCDYLISLGLAARRVI